uniref:NADH dehydrogenase subunit 3 n=1 Tax=Dematophora necatrix TaxID=2751867 RepID=UPI0030DE635F
MRNLTPTYQEKYSIFECGFHSFLGQNRTQFGIKFFMFGFIYLLLDLEILLIFPFASSEYVNSIYGLSMVLIFTLILTLGFTYEIAKNALKIESRQVRFDLLKKSNEVTELLGKTSDFSKLECVLKNINNSPGSNILDNSLNNSSESKILNNSLNHHLKKYYLKIVNAKGHYLYTEDGREIFDAASGAAVACIGYGNEKVIEAICDKYKQGVHYLSTSYWKDEDVLKLNDFLLKSTEYKMSKVFITGSGSDAIEASIKVARQYFFDKDKETQRHVIIARENSYHGNTLGALSVSNFIVRQEPYYPIMTDNVEHISSCNPYRQQIEGESDAAFIARKAQELENKINEIGPEKVMCFIMEPVSGAALGCVPAPLGYLKAMQEVCHKYGVLLIFDEIMCGMGRTGTLHAWEVEGVVPDILVIGKGLAGGYFPLSAILVNTKVCEGLKTQEFIHGHTFDAVPVGAVAALIVQEIIKKWNLLENVSKQGVYLRDSLKAKLGDHPNVGDVRGIGLFIGIELVKDKTTKEPFDTNVGVAQIIVDLALSEYNMTIYKGTGGADGLNGDHIMIQPPFTITAKDVDHIVEVVTAVIERVFE